MIAIAEILLASQLGGRPERIPRRVRYVKRQLGPASIEEMEGTSGHLAAGRHEPYVDRLAGSLGADAASADGAAASTGVHALRKCGASARRC